MRQVSSVRSSSRKPGLSLVELLVSIGLLAFVSTAAYKFFHEGYRYLRTQEAATEGQREALAILSILTSGLQSTSANLILSDPEGVVYASPRSEAGVIAFDPTDGGLLWQRWICLYYDGTTLEQREQDLTIPVSNPGAPPAPSAFGGARMRRVLSRQVTRFEVEDVSTGEPRWAIRITVGSMDLTAPHGMELESEISPRN